MSDAEVTARFEALQRKLVPLWTSIQTITHDPQTIVVVPSMGEGFGMVALEAMERARPVIAAEIGGLGELVEDGVTGRLVRAGDPQPLAHAIVGLGRDLDAAARMGEAGRRRALDRFLQERCTDRTELLYREQLNGRFRKNGALPTRVRDLSAARNS